MQPSSIPDAVPAIPLSRETPGLVWTRDQVGRLGGVGVPCSLDTAATGVLTTNTPVELEEDAFVVLGQRIGTGRQGIVYSVATCHHICVKVCRNDRAAKQFRRERLGVRHFDSLGVAYPAILAGDAFGKWIVKEQWHGVETGEIMLSATQRQLPPRAISSLHEHVEKFEKAGLCADWMPSNVVFGPGGCATFETSVWPVESCGWSFATCFLPVWLPHGVAESYLEGFPPYIWAAPGIDETQRAWRTDPAYETWRALFGEAFPMFCSDWWMT